MIAGKSTEITADNEDTAIFCHCTTVSYRHSTTANNRTVPASAPCTVPKLAIGNVLQAASDTVSQSATDTVKIYRKWQEIQRLVGSMQSEHTQQQALYICQL